MNNHRQTRSLNRLALAVALSFGALSLGALTLAALPAAALAAPPQQATQAPGWYRVMVGAAEVTALSDGTVPLPVDQLLHTPAGQSARVAEGLAAHFQHTPLETSVNAWLIHTGSRLVLVDAGAGRLFGPTLGQLLAQIRAAGYQPEQVDDILITHMHPDHVGGLAADGQRVFVNATVHAHRADAELWLSQAKADAAPAAAKGFFQGAMASLEPYQQAGRLKTFDGEAELVPGIRSLVAPGHTPGHTAYVLDSQGQRLVLIGDLIHVASVQLAAPEVTIAFDVDEPQAAATRQRVFTQLAREGSLVAATHFSFPGMGRLRAAGNGWAWLPMDYRSQVR